MMIIDAVKKLVENRDLSFQEAADLVDFIGEGNALPTQIAALLTALKMKGETPEEISGFAYKMREKAVRLDLNHTGEIVDSCGTGGDCSNTFNISTSSAILGSSCGLNVAKHSNFGMTGKCGSSNVLSALGINLVNTAEEAEEYFKRHNIVFLHAPFFHKATSSVNPVRKEIGIRTIFNFLGPLTNPARPTGQVLGVACPKTAPKIAEALRTLGCKKALVVHGQNPTMDEISICGKTTVYKLENNILETFDAYPEDFGMKRASLEEIIGGEPEHNADLIEKIFSGQITGAKKDAVVLNSAGLLWVGNIVNSIEEGISTASNLIESGKALNKLNELKNLQ